MMCFRDMAFCSAYPTQCKNTGCSRAFTSIDREAARHWWGKNGEPPIATANFYADCKDKVPA